MTDYISNAAAAIMVAAERLPLPTGWPHSGLAAPTKNRVSKLRAAGWPIVMVDVMLPQHEHRGPHAGQRTGDAVQPVACVPLTWLARMAEIQGAPWSDACRYEVPDEG